PYWRVRRCATAVRRDAMASASSAVASFSSKCIRQLPRLPLHPTAGRFRARLNRWGDGLAQPVETGAAGMPARLIGRHIVADPNVCHGRPTFRSTRILVSDVLEQLADGMAWETVIQEWHGSISREAIAEALQLATRALLEHVDDYVLRS